MSRAAKRSWPILVAIFLGADATALLDARPDVQESSATTASQTPTYNEDVAPILNAKCVSCHRSNQIAPMAFSGYREVRPWARAIKAKVVSREMPPWSADPQVGTLKFKNDPSLSDREIATITAWVDGGAPEGTGTPPPPPRFSAGGWTHPSGRDPDFVYEFPVELQLPAAGEMPNFNAYTPLPFNDRRLIEATEIRPGNYKATHHLTANPTTLPPGMKLGRGPAWPGGPVLDCDCVLVPDKSAPPAKEESTEDRVERSARNAGNGGAGIQAYIPGTTARPSRPGQARELRGDQLTHIVWNLHYQATGKPERGRPAIGFWFAQGEPKDTEVVRGLNLREYASENKLLIARPEQVGRLDRRRVGAQVQDVNPLLDPIPPNAGNWTVTGIGAIQNDSTIQSVFVHAHLRGKDFTLLLTHPDGREEILMRVPKYSFDWQFTYELAEPLAVSAGSTIKAISRYDNSTANKFNPAPHKEVYWSEQSWDDMYLVTVQYTTNAPVVPASTRRAAN